MSKVAKAFLSLAIVFLLQTGCISRGELIREGTEVAYCTEEACVPRSNEFTEEWGPVRLYGKITIPSLQLIAWGKEIEKQLADASAKIKEKIDAMECGPNCNKEATGDLKLTLILGSENMMTYELPEDHSCRYASEEVLEVSASFLTCEGALVLCINGVNGALDSARELCQKRGEGCDVAEVHINLDESADNLEIVENEEGYGCTVTVRSKVTVRCGKGESKNDSPSLKGQITAHVKCSEPDQCADFVRGKEEPASNTGPDTQGTFTKGESSGGEY